MARLPRLTVPGQPHHVVQRGNNRQPVFADDADYRQLLALVDAHARQLKVAVHGYVLMPAHFHLLATPHEAGALPALMQAVGRRYVRYFNARHGRTGTLWEGRYRSTLLQPERYLLPCMVYQDLNPVRDGLSADPAAYPWSSHRHYAGIATDRVVTPHPAFWALGDTPFAREQAYVQLVADGLAPEKERALTDATHRGWALGDPSYLSELEKLGARRAVPKLPGRPRKLPVPNS
jgi:putative transposase